MTSKASRLLAKGELVSFETETGIVDFNIRPLKNKELLDIMDCAEKKDTRTMILKLLKFTLEKDDPEITFQDIENLEVAYLQKILQTIERVNKLDGMFSFHEGGQSSEKRTSLPASNPALAARIEQLRQARTAQPTV